MTDPTPIIVGCLVGFSVFFFIVSLAGRGDPSQPCCRACGRDARPFAWLERHTCACGANLGQSGAVHIKRLRSWKAPVLTVALVASAIVVTREGARLARTGGQWRDHLPASMFGALIGYDPGHDNERSLGIRVHRGLGADEAQSILKYAVNGAPSSDPQKRDAIRAIVHDVIEFAPPFELDDASARLTLRGARAIVNPAESELVLEFFAEEMGLGIALRLESVEVNGREVAFEVRDRRGYRYDAWFPNSNAIQVCARDIEGLTAKAKIVVRGEVAALPSQLPVRPDAYRQSPAPEGAPPITMRPDQWLVTPTRGHFALTPDVVIGADSPEAQALYGFSAPFTACESRAMLAAELDVDAIALRYLGPIAAALAGVALGVLALPMFSALLRGGYGLAPPRCARCSMQLRGAGASVPQRCSECGADTRPPRATRWISRRGSRSRAVTATVAALAVAVVGGELARRGAVAFYQEHVASSEPLALRLLTMMEARGDDADLAWTKIQYPDPALPISLVSDAQAIEVAQRLLALSEDRSIRVRYRPESLLRSLHERLSSIAPAPPELRLIEELIMRGARVTLPAKALVGDPIKAELFMGPEETVVARIEVEGAAPTWINNRPIATFSEPGTYEFVIDIYEQVNPPRAVAMKMTSNDDYAKTAMRHRRETHTVEVVDDVSALDEAVVDPSRDPFTTPGFVANVSLYEINGCREAMLEINGPGSELIKGRFELTVDGAPYTFQPIVLDNNYPRVMIPSGAMPPAIQLRYTPMQLTISQTGARAERPHWALERTIELAKVWEQKARGRTFATYSTAGD